MEKLFGSLSHQKILYNKLDETIARELTSWELAALLPVHCVMRSISYWAQGLFLRPNYLIPVPNGTKVSKMRCKSMNKIFTKNLTFLDPIEEYAATICKCLEIGKSKALSWDKIPIMKQFWAGCKSCNCWALKWGELILLLSRVLWPNG